MAWVAGWETLRRESEGGKKAISAQGDSLLKRTALLGKTKTRVSLGRGETIFSVCRSLIFWLQGRKPGGEEKISRRQAGGMLAKVC